MVYSIQLQLRVDDSQLDATIAKLGTLKKAAKDIHVRTAGNLPRRLKLPEEDIIARSARKWKQRNLEERLNIGARWHLRQFGQWRFSQAGWQNGLGGKLLGTDRDVSALLDGLSDEAASREAEFITVFYGEDVNEEDAHKACDAFTRKCPDAEVNLICGGQPVYYYIISIE